MVTTIEEKLNYPEISEKLSDYEVMIEVMIEAHHGNFIIRKVTT